MAPRSGPLGADFGFSSWLLSWGESPGNLGTPRATHRPLCYPLQPVASILDLAVVLLALMVCVSMGLLAWTLGVSIPRMVRRSRASIVEARLELATAERRLREALRERASSTGDEGDE